jgi:FKBP-type peptidyl-prolyl cis-trans isomerase FkpA
MNRTISMAALLALLLAACGGPAPEGGGEETADAESSGAVSNPEPQAAGETASEPPPTDGVSGAAPADSTQIVPGLTMRVLQPGSGETAEPGQVAVVHYTGWLYDPESPDNRGTKFDSSVDRGQPFEFPLGGGAVIEGWDRGVAGMQVGEVRELTIAPELAYGERGAGGVIPPGATLVFQVELLEVRS